MTGTIHAHMGVRDSDTINFVHCKKQPADFSCH